MDIIDRLESEHQRVMDLVARFGDVEGAPSTEQLLVQLAQELSLHEQAEEAAVWYELRGTLKNGEALEEAIIQETELETILEELVLALDAKDLPARVIDFRTRLVRHVQTEENRVFPLIQQEVDQARREQLAMAYDDTKANLLAQMAKMNVVIAPEVTIEQPGRTTKPTS